MFELNLQFLTILLQRECEVTENDTVDSLYNGFMYPEGIRAMAEAVNLVAQEKAPKNTQAEEGATYDAFLNKPELCKLVLQQPAKKIHDFIRGLDSSPGTVFLNLIKSKCPLVNGFLLFLTVLTNRVYHDTTSYLANCYGSLVRNL